MTTNHPANGPVSLNRLHQISEILSKAAAQSDGGNLGYAMADAVKVIDGAIASFDAEPVLYAAEETLAYAKMGELHLKCLSQPMGDAVIPLYTAPPAPVVPTFDEWLEIRGNKPLGWVKDAMRESYDACRAAMLQTGNFLEIPDSSTNNCREISETSTNGHEIETHTLLKSIEGMEVSVDVSTCDADAGHRYFGTVTEISELDTAKNGYILLVQDAKPNFKQADNSPATLDCSCRTCRPVTFTDSRFVVCPECGNKRCPHANDHRNACTGSNELGQEGSAYPAVPQQEVK